jgi:hypothetical protein
MMGEKGDDVIRGGDELYGGEGDDVIYGGDGNDPLFGEQGDDVLYGGDGNDFFRAEGDGQRDKLYCGNGKDRYRADKIDYVDSSCEVKTYAPPLPFGNDVSSATPSVSDSPLPGPPGGTGGPAILLPAAALLLGSSILTYAILRRR